jgi:hypothetical protein
LSALINKAIDKLDKKVSLLYKSAVAIFLLFSLIIGSSYAWFMDDRSSRVSEDYITIAADEGLRMQYNDNKLLSEPIQIDSIANKLSECSSIDGRDIFFPTSDFADGKSLTSGFETEDLLFRSAGVNDKNTNYISIDFTLTTDSDTGVWISNESYISGAASEAIRLSLDKNDGTKPLVFDTTETGRAYEHNVVSNINNSGVVTKLAEQIPLALGDYYYGNVDENVLFYIRAGEKLDMTMTVWLEGADDDCASSAYDKSDLAIHIKFATGVNDAKLITFVDETYEKWIAADDNKYMYVKDKDSSAFYEMIPSRDLENDHTWSVYLPKTVENIQFVQKVPKERNESFWKIWDGGKIKDSSGNYKKGSIYKALGEPDSISTTCGIWKDNLEPITVYFVNQTGNDWSLDGKTEIYMNYGFTDDNGVSQYFTYKMTYLEDENRYAATISARAKFNYNFYKYVDGERVDIWSDSRSNNNQNIYTATAESTGTSGTKGSWGILAE